MDALRTRLKQVLPLLVALCFLFLLVSGAWLLSPVQTESSHLASGISHALFFRFDLYRVNPPLVRCLAALPSILQIDRKSPAWDRIDPNPLKRSESLVALELFSKRDDFRQLIFYGRLCVLPLVLVALIFIFHYSKSLYGWSPGVLALFLWSLNPYVLGQGCTIMPDVPSASLAVTSVYFFRKWLKEPSSESSFASGAILGIAELTKFTLIVLYPLYIILWFLYRLPKIGISSAVPLRRQIFQVTLMFATSLIVINMGYLFEGTGQLLKSYRFKTVLLTEYKTLDEIPSDGGNRFNGSGNIIETAFGYLPLMLPKNYIQGIDTQRYDFEKGFPSYLRGHWSDHGWWYYYLYALLIKTPFGVIGIFFLALVCSFVLKGYNTTWQDEILVLLPGISIVFCVCSQTGFSVHSRYIIPAIPFFTIWMSKIGRAFLPEIKQKSPISSRYIRYLTLFFLLWSGWSIGRIYPHSIAYFNELAAVIPTSNKRIHLPDKSISRFSPIEKINDLFDYGFLNGSLHLNHSNVDWGQGIFALERWCKKHPEIKEIKTDTWPGFPIKLTSIPSTGLPPSEKVQPGWFAISVNYLHDRTGKYQYFLHFKPKAIIGYTIYIYHISSADIEQLKEDT